MTKRKKDVEIWFTRGGGIAKVGPFPGTFPHGTRARYVRGCRCGECRHANTLYVRDLRARRRDGERSRPERLAILKRLDGMTSVEVVREYPHVWPTRNHVFRDRKRLASRPSVC